VAGGGGGGRGGGNCPRAPAEGGRREREDEKKIWGVISLQCYNVVIMLCDVVVHRCCIATATPMVTRCLSLTLLTLVLTQPTVLWPKQRAN
jgi:hypothetical protein